MTKTFYEILEISPDASPEEIRKAYKKQALRTHPDRAPPEKKSTAEADFRRVNAAYEVLIDKENRRIYDLHGVWPPPGPEDYRDSQRGASGSNGPNPYDPDDSFYHYPGHYPPRAGRRAAPDSFYGHTAFFMGMPTFRPQAFRDPFELFNSVFAEFERMNSDFARVQGLGTRGGPLGAPPPLLPIGFTQSPFSMFNDPFFSPALIEDEAFNDPFFRGQSRSGRPRVTEEDEGPVWISQSRMTRSVNGVTESVLKTTDSSGNEYVTYDYPDGTKRHLVNGVEKNARIGPSPPIPPRIQSRPKSPLNINTFQSHAHPPSRSKSKSVHSLPSHRASTSHSATPPPPTPHSSRYASSTAPPSAVDSTHPNRHPTPDEHRHKAHWWQHH